MINFDFHKECTGCCGCADTCPKQCIKMVEDCDGFLIPFIDIAACIDCGKCEQICPVLNHNVESFERRKCYAIHHLDPDIRRVGSSGSVFFALAEQTILQNGVVYAAALDDHLTLRHIKATDLGGIIPQMKSKYLQSDTQGVYKQVLIDLKKGTPVLFVGTPCQCQALHNMTPTSIRNSLVIVDIICHGVPSQSLFNMSIAHYEEIHHCKVKAFSFREKTDNSLRNFKATILQNDEQTIEKIGNLDTFPFCMGYFNHIIQRNSCFNCKLRGVNRVADLTIGDFWALEKIRPSVVDFNKGYSVVIVNTSLGESVIKQLKACSIDEVADGVSFVVSHNYAYTKQDNKSLMRNLFFFCLRHYGYDFCERHLLQQTPRLPYRLLNSLVIRIDRFLKFTNIIS